MAATAMRSKTILSKTLIYPVFIPMRGCPGHCIYCDQYAISGAGDLLPPDAVPGAERFVRQHPGREKEIAFYGGSFTALPLSERESLLDGFDPIRDGCTGYRVSTHPAFIDPGILAWCRQRGIRTIELGIQDFHDRVLMSTGRGYTSQQAIAAARMVQENGFDLGVQLMPGLPGWDAESLARNHAVLKELRPTYLRVYPCVVLRGTTLEKLHRDGSFTPLTLDEAIAQAADYSALADAAGIIVIKLGIPSNLDPAWVAGGPWHPAFGQLVQAELLVRHLAAEYASGSHIRLTKNQYALLRAHGLYYLNILHKRIGNCSVEVV